MKNDTNKKILETAKELFSLYGYKGTSTKSIAQKAEVNEVTLFRNFGNKAGILDALHNELVNNKAAWKIDLENIKNTNPLEIFIKLAEIEIENALNYGLLTIKLSFEMETSPEIKKLFREGASDHIKKLATYIKKLQSNGIVKSNYSPEIISETFFSSTSSFLIHRIGIIKSNDPVRLKTNEITQMIEIFWSGISK